MHKKQERPAARTLLVCTRAKRQFRAKSFSFDSFLCSQRKEYLPQLNESNDQIHGLGDDFIRGFLHEGGPPCIGIQHPGLIAQDHAVNFRGAVQSDVEGVAPIGVGNGADHGHAADAVKEIAADHQGRTAALLLMAGLGVKVQINNISLLKYRHHASPPSGQPQSTSRSASTAEISSRGFP